jgi:hypothetical protein
MDAVEELDQARTLNQITRLADFDSTIDAASTQQLLDELLGRCEDDDSTRLPAYCFAPESYAGCNE